MQEDNVSEEQDNCDSPRDVIFMVLIQDENSIGENSLVNGAPTNTSKLSKKWTYNGIYLPYPKYEEKKN